mmetsp:Transcript_20383/g.30065  ORF Transcript_20383/g.30065 Transcript_20383/m.30065 type:complete len:491 (+) Transcript_20383:134-1606(+)
MSSLSATQADGYYIPPAYLNSGQYKKKSVTQFNHPNHKGHNQYLSSNVLRFEFPYDGFCLNPSCRAHVGKGTRFNAQKKYLGAEYDYHTSKVYEFRMTCRSCASKKTNTTSKCTSIKKSDNITHDDDDDDVDYTFVIRNNPEKRRFDYISGVKRKVEEFDTVDAKSLGVIDTDYGHAIHNFTDGELKANGNGGKLKSNSKSSGIDRLEREIMGERKTMTDRDAMEQLLQHNHTIMYDDAMSNSKMRASYRVQRKRKKRRLDDAKEMGLGRGIELDPRIREDNDDEKNSNRDDSTGDEFRKALESRKDIRDEKSRKREKSKFLSIRSTSIFGKNKISKRSSRSSRISNNSRRHMARNNKNIGIGHHRNENSGNDCKEKKKLNISIQGQGQGATPLRIVTAKTKMKAATVDVDLAARSHQIHHGNINAHTGIHRDSDSDNTSFSAPAAAAADHHISSPLKLLDCDMKTTKEGNGNNCILQSLANYGSESDSD